MAVKDNLLSYRKQAGMSQQELADKCCVSRQAITAYEAGVRTPDEKVIQKLVEVFKCTADDLIFGPKSSVKLHR